MLTDKQKKKAASFKDLSLTPNQKMAKDIAKNAIAVGRSADYYEGFGDALELIASMGLKTNELEHVLTVLPLLATVLADKLRELDEEDKEEDLWVPNELVM